MKPLASAISSPLRLIGLHSAQHQRGELACGRIIAAALQSLADVRDIIAVQQSRSDQMLDERALHSLSEGRRCLVHLNDL